MEKIVKLHFFLLFVMLPFLNAEQQKDEINNKKSLPLEESSNKNEYNFFSVERGFTCSTGLGFGTGFFINSKINHLIFRPYYMFAINNFDFLAVAMILIHEDYDISKKFKYSSSYIGTGVNWHIANLASKTKIFLIDLWHWRTILPFNKLYRRL